MKREQYDGLRLTGETSSGYGEEELDSDYESDRLDDGLGIDLTGQEPLG